MGQSPAAVPLQVVLNVKNEGNRGEKKKRREGRESEGGREKLHIEIKFSTTRTE